MICARAKSQSHLDCWVDRMTSVARALLIMSPLANPISKSVPLEISADDNSPGDEQLECLCVRPTHRTPQRQTAQT